jgi:hypothetical protein
LAARASPAESHGKTAMAAVNPARIVHIPMEKC